MIVEDKPKAQLKFKVEEKPKLKVKLDHEIVTIDKDLEEYDSADEFTERPPWKNDGGWDNAGGGVVTVAADKGKGRESTKMRETYRHFTPRAVKRVNAVDQSGRDRNLKMTMTSKQTVNQPPLLANPLYQKQQQHKHAVRGEKAKSSRALVMMGGPSRPGPSSLSSRGIIIYYSLYVLLI